MHRVLEAKEASLIEIARGNMMGKVTNLQTQCVPSLPHARKQQLN